MPRDSSFSPTRRAILLELFATWRSRRTMARSRLAQDRCGGARSDQASDAKGGGGGGQVVTVVCHTVCRTCRRPQAGKHGRNSVEGFVKHLRGPAESYRTEDQGFCRSDLRHLFPVEQLRGLGACSTLISAVWIPPSVCILKLLCPSACRLFFCQSNCLSACLSH